MTYAHIAPLDEDFTDAEASSVEGLREAWEEQRESLADSGALSEFQARLIRRWAIETGIIERLYTLDRGTTELLIVRGLDAALIEHGASDLPGPALVRILEDHREAADYVLDHVAQQRDLSPHFVRSLHSLLTRHQDSVEAEDQFGRRYQMPLLRGTWKRAPNNPRRPDGTLHAYCPPELVEDEVQALLAGFGKLVGRRTPAITAAAWLHHRFTQIHPFQDGNGRVARALTAFALVQAGCFPIVIDRDLRGDYINALETADAGDLRPLVRLFARLQKQELENALSLAESTLAPPTPSFGGTLREKLLLALRDKAREKRNAITEGRRRVLELGLDLAQVVIRPAAEAWAQAVQAVLDTELPGSRIIVEWSDDRTRHWFKGQIVEVAQANGYYCDIETFHEWVRVQVRRPGENEERYSEVVVSVHSLGRLFTGVLAAQAYFATRFLDEDRRSQTLPPHPLTTRPLTFSHHEDSANVRERLSEWIEAALDVGLGELLKSL
jgi:Fic family protein